MPWCSTGSSWGADLKVTDNSTPVGGGLATADRNKAPVQPATTSASHVQGVQSLCASSGPGPAVGPSSTLGTPMIVPPLCEGQPYVTVANTYANSIVVLFRNGSIAGMAGGDLGNITMALGGGAKWALGDEAVVLQYVGSTVSPKSAPAFANCSKQNVVTQHNDNQRSGANLAEAVLKPSNVNPSTFGLLYTRMVEGDTVSQPLYVHGVRTASGLKNLIFVTTSLNNVYAFDADNKNPSAGAAALVWQHHLCGSVLSGVCPETASRLVGITSTPVIDVTLADDVRGGAVFGRLRERNRWRDLRVRVEHRGWHGKNAARASSGDGSQQWPHIRLPLPEEPARAATFEGRHVRSIRDVQLRRGLP